jgi:hypothetical protein
MESATSLGVDNPEEESKDLVIYEMTDGMRTSTKLSAADAYIDGGLFALRLIHLLKIFGSKSCYVNVIEERHKLRDNYSSIFSGLKSLFPIYQKYSKNNHVRLKFLGDLDQRLEPHKHEGDFASDLNILEKETENNDEFTAYFLINYSLDWAIKNQEKFKDLPAINQIVRHTKFQLPTGMMLPPFLSDFSSFVYVQQGSSSSTWSDIQLICLISLAIRSMVINRGTQYFKKYNDSEVNTVRIDREIKAHMHHNNLFSVGNRKPMNGKNSSKIKRSIIAGPIGPEIYEF